MGNFLGSNVKPNEYYDPKNNESNTATSPSPQSKHTSTPSLLHRTPQEKEEDIQKVETKLKSFSEEFLVNYSKYAGISPSSLSRALGTVEGMANTFFNPAALSNEDEDFQSSVVAWNKSGDVKVKVKLMLVETGIWPWMPTGVNSIVAACMNDNTPYGLVHAALQVGPYIIDWTSQGLVTPHKLKSSSPLLVVDLNNDDSMIVLDTENIRKISEKIVQWNVSRHYGRWNSVEKNECNCQKFVTELLEALNLKAQFSGPVASFLRDLNNNGTSQMEFVHPKTNEKRVFKSHNELDVYAHCLKREYCQEPWFEDHWMLLKGFDRAFWMVVSLSPPGNQPHTHVPSQLGCPFGDPNFNVLDKQRTLKALTRSDTGYLNLSDLSNKMSLLTKNANMLTQQEKSEEVDFLQQTEQDLIELIQSDDFHDFERIGSAALSESQLHRQLLESTLQQVQDLRKALIEGSVVKQ